MADFTYARLAFLSLLEERQGLAMMRVSVPQKDKKRKRKGQKVSNKAGISGQQALLYGYRKDVQPTFVPIKA